MLRVIFKRGLLIASVVLTIALVCLSIRSIWFAGDTLLVATGADFQLHEAGAPLEFAGIPPTPPMYSLEAHSTFYSLRHWGGTLRLQQIHPDPALRLALRQEDIRHESASYIIVSLPPASRLFDRANWWRWELREHGFAITILGFTTGVTLPADTPPGVQALGRRQGLVVQLPLPLLALIAAMPALFWLWRRYRRRRRKGFEVTLLPAAGADAPPGTHQRDEGLVRPPGGDS